MTDTDDSGERTGGNRRLVSGWEGRYFEDFTVGDTTLRRLVTYACVRPSPTRALKGVRDGCDESDTAVQFSRVAEFAFGFDSDCRRRAADAF